MNSATLTAVYCSHESYKQSNTWKSTLGYASDVILAAEYEDDLIQKLQACRSALETEGLKDTVCEPKMVF